MRTLLALLLVGLVAVPALAGQNPDVRIYVDFDPPNYVHEFCPTAGAEYYAYIMVDNLTPDPDPDTDPPYGMTNVSFAIGIVNYGWQGGSWTWTNELPGDLQQGNFDEGVTVTANQCMLSPGPIMVASGKAFWFAGACEIFILDHPEYPRWVVDCGQPIPANDFYCVLSHGGFCMPAPDGDCVTNPVEDATWGNIKALYR
jgi:hypothetical protein